MKTSIFAALLTVVLSMALPTSSWAGGPRGGKGGMQGAAKACKVLSAEALTQAEIDTLMYMREEEKMARDLYIRFNEIYGGTVRVFGNISRSEQKHMDAVKGLLDAYGLLEDPVKDDVVGVFTNPVLAAQFTTLMDQGKTLKGALEVGVIVEEQDLEDLAAAIAETDVPCIDRVYSNLLRGSTNHLAAFNRVLGRF
jgi:hypothetical protein